MTERERLIKLIEQCSCHYSPPCTGECGECHNVEMYDRNIEHIADHLLANGVIVPPVKIGQTVYSIEPCISQVFVGEVYEIFQSRYGLVCRSSRKGYYSLAFPADSVGKTVFLTREEAEKALEGKV